MVELPLYNKVFVLLIDIIGFLLAAMVYRRNPKGKINKIFISMAVFMFCWVNFAFFARLVGGTDLFLALIFLKIAWFAAPLLFTFLYFLAVELLNKWRNYGILNKAVFAFGSLAALFTSSTDLVIKGTTVVDNILTIIYGSGLVPFLGIIAFLMLATLYVLFREYFKAPANEKVKIEYVLAGVFIFYLANLFFNVSFPIFFKIFEFYWMGDYSSVALLGFIGYAITKQQLFGVRIVLTALLTGLIAIILFLDAFFFTETFSMQVLKGISFSLFLVFGFYLIRGTLREIKYREQLQTAFQKLKTLDDAKSEFISIASHQLRTPLAAIKGYISMLKEGSYGLLSKKQTVPMDNVYQSNERLIKLVNDLLNLSRLEAGKLEFKPEMISLKKLIFGAVEELKINAEKKGLYLRIEGAEISLPVDADKLRQVFLNIIDNAIKYTNQGEISIKTRILNTKCQIRISDTGEGMGKEEIENLFEMFSRAAQGTGVGLYVAKKFVEMHKGKIWAESEGRGKGSTFFIELPVK